MVRRIRSALNRIARDIGSYGSARYRRVIGS